MGTFSHSALGAASAISMLHLQKDSILGSERPGCFIRAGERCDYAVLIQRWAGTMLSMSHLPGQHHYPSSPSNWQRGFGWPLAFKNQNHCSLQVCTCYYLCLQKWKSLDLLYLPCTCHSHLAHSHQGTAVYIIRWKKIYKVWSDLWDPILRFKVWFGPDRVLSRSGPRWTPNWTPPKNYDSSGLDPEPVRTWGLVQSGLGPDPIWNRIAASLALIIFDQTHAGQALSITSVIHCTPSGPPKDR